MPDRPVSSPLPAGLPQPTPKIPLLPLSLPPPQPSPSPPLPSSPSHAYLSPPFLNVWNPSRTSPRLLSSPAFSSLLPLPLPLPSFSDWNPQWDLQAMARVHRIGQVGREGEWGRYRGGAGYRG